MSYGLTTHLTHVYDYENGGDGRGCVPVGRLMRAEKQGHYGFALSRWQVIDGKYSGYWTDPVASVRPLTALELLAMEAE